MSHFGIIGGGAFGTALATSLASDGSPVRLWLRDPACADTINATHENTQRLPGIKLAHNIQATAQIADLLNAEAILLVLPAQSTKAFLQVHLDALPDVPLILCAKGITQDTYQLQSELLPSERTIAVLTGPGFADEIARGLPTALTLASKAQDLEALQILLSRPNLRLYRTRDVIGAQLGGALKNVVAIAAGIAVGAELGESARAAIITRGFSEMRDLAREMGAEDTTLAGLSGFGDLALTCTSEKSRNFAHGLALGRSTSQNTATVEGIATARAAVTLAQRHGVEMPIAQAVARVLEGKNTVPEALQMLLSRPLKAE